MRQMSGGVFCYNAKVIGRIRPAGCFFFAALLTSAAVGASGQGLNDMTTGLQDAFAARDLSAYTSHFAPAIREREGLAASSFMNLWRMTSLVLRRADRGAEKEGDPGVYVQAFYQNRNAAMLEMWHVWLERADDRWLIAKKEVTGSITSLYKIRIPSERVARARRVEVRHQDIGIVFEDAWVFYDDVPDLETALLVVGKGRLHFAPSNATERHQLELRYKATSLDDELEYAFLRFSDSFFGSNITIDNPSFASAPPQSLVNRAYALFSKCYPLSFTIENSITSDLLSFAPRGDQVVFDVKAVHAGDIAYINSPFSEDEIHLLRRNPDQVINLYSPEKPEETGRNLFVSFGEKFDVRRVDLELNFQPEKFYLSARARVTVASQIDNVESLKFNFNPSLDILRLTDQEGHDLFYTQDKFRKLLYVYFVRPIGRSEPATIEMFYRGPLEPPVQLQDVHPGGQFNDTISLANPRFETYLYSLASYWYPTPPEEDYFLATLRISIPPQYRCVANGRLLEQGTIDAVRGVGSLDKVGNAVYLFETQYPVKYLSFIVGLFDPMVNGAKSASPEISGYVASEIRVQRRGLLEDARAMVEAYEAWFGPYPYEKLSIVQRLWPTSGGHSPASFVVLNELPRTPDSPQVVDPYSPVDMSRYKEYYLAHEIAHQWWGQAVTWERYHDQWLSEGLAQFAAIQFLRAKLGDRVFAGILKKFSQWVERKSVFGPISLGSRLSYLDFDAYQAILYDKSAIVLNMLRDLLGEDTFLKGLKSFFAAYRYKPARTSNFRKSLEEASGRDLSAFFKGWFDSHLLPEVHVAHEVLKRGDGFILKIRVNQTREIFAFPLWVTWLESGRTVRRMLDVSGPTQEYEFTMGARPTKIAINPEKAVPGTFK